MSEDQGREYGSEGEDQLGQRPHAESPDGAEQEVADKDEEIQAQQSASRALSSALRTSFLGLKIIMACLVGMYLLRGCFVVEQNEVRFKLSFGKAVPDSAGRLALTSEGGMRFRWPWQDVVTVTTDEQQIELLTEFWSTGATLKRGLNPKIDGYLLAGDQNIVHLKLRVRYQLVRSPSGDEAGEEARKRFTRQVYDHAFSVGPEETRNILRHEAMRAATRVVASMRVRDVLNITGLLEADPDSTRNGIKEQLIQNLADFEDKAGCSLGVRIVAVETVQSTRDERNPSEPEAVAAAFRNEEAAESEKAGEIENGKRQAKSMVEDAKSESGMIVSRAENRARKTVEDAKAAASRLNSHRSIATDENGFHPEVLRLLLEQQRLGLLQEVLTGASGAIILHEPENGGGRQIQLIIPRPPMARPSGTDQKKR